MRRSVSLATAILVIAGALAGCGGSADAGANGTCELDAPVKVGAALSLTGDAAAYGAAQRNALELARDQLNARGGVQYDLAVEDDATDPKQGITVFENLIARRGVSIVLGPTLSNGAMQTDPVAQAFGVPVLGMSNTATGITDIGDYVFRDSLSETAVVPQTVAKAKAAFGLRRVVLMYSDDDAMTESGYQAFRKTLESNGLDIVKTVTFSKNDSDFRAKLADAKAAAPDALVVSALIEAAIHIVSQARQVGITAPIIGNNGFNSTRLMKDAGPAAEGVVVGSSWNEASPGAKNADFVRAYQARFGVPADPFAAMAYTALFLVDEAVRAGCSAERDSVKAHLGALRNIDTVLGDFSFDGNRDANHLAVIQIVRDGKFAVLQ